MEGANILFPLGQLLLIIGLAIIVAIFVVQIIFFVRSSVEERRLIPLFAGVVLVVLSASWDLVRGGFSTYANLFDDFNIHHHLFPIFFIVSACSAIALYVDDKKRRAEESG